MAFYRKEQVGGKEELLRMMAVRGKKFDREMKAGLNVDLRMKSVLDR